MGVYSSFQSGGPGVRSYIMFDILGGNIRGNSGTSKDQINSMLSSLNSYQNTSWAGYFYILYQVNNLIKAAEKYPGSSEATLALGESHYFRAYLYYCMVTRWAIMPILRGEYAGERAARPCRAGMEFHRGRVGAGTGPARIE